MGHEGQYGSEGSAQPIPLAGHPVPEALTEAITLIREAGSRPGHAYSDAEILGRVRAYYAAAAVLEAGRSRPSPTCCPGPS